MKVIFLDIDGVLNSTKSIKKNKSTDYGRFYDNPSMESIRALNQIIAKTGAVCVISSVWRLGCDWMNIWRILDLCGFDGEIIGSTPINNKGRGSEIAQWLIDEASGDNLTVTRNEIRPVESYVIIDDDVFDITEKGQKKHIIKTDSEVGLTGKDAEKAIKILNDVPEVSTVAEPEIKQKRKYTKKTHKADDDDDVLKAIGGSK